MPNEHLKPWDPLSPDAVHGLFREAKFLWWIAGGYAIEQFVGHVLRPHGDIDVLVLRRDRAAVRSMLADWDCWAADPPGTLRPWPVDESLPLAVSDVWCRPNRDAPWRLQLMFDDGEGDRWRSRRCAAVTRPLSGLGQRDGGGIPFLAPEVQLFYKAKAPRAKDELDFAAVLPLLSQPQRVWLRDAVTVAYGRDVPWLKRLETVAG
jgi:hypothetical protein